MRSKLGFTHFTSDPHYLHANIIGFCGRPFRDVDHQVEELISRFNEVVGTEDHALFLGDLFLNTQRGGEILGRLNGRKSLVAGNHDKGRMDWGFLMVEPLSLRDEIDGTKVLYCHFPYADPESRDQRYRELRPVREPGTILIHGHSHSKERTGVGTIHVGVDAWDYRPVSCAEVAACFQL